MIAWRKSSFSDTANSCVMVGVEVQGWTTSSRCSGGDCVQIRHDSDTVYVRDSKLGDDSPVQRWELDEWRDLLRLIKWEWTPDGVSRLADGYVEFGLERHDKLTFTGDEWEAFRRGVIDEEFEIDKLREFRSSSSRRGVAEEDREGSGGVTGQPGPGEPDDKSFVLFDYLVDKEIWFRDDDLAAEVRSRSGSDDDERWFQVGDQDGDALCWASVLRANPDAVAVMLTRSDAPLVPAVETQETGS